MNSYESERMKNIFKKKLKHFVYQLWNLKQNTCFCNLEWDISLLSSTVMNHIFSGDLPSTYSDLMVPETCTATSTFCSRSKTPTDQVGPLFQPKATWCCIAKSFFLSPWQHSFCPSHLYQWCFECHCLFNTVDLHHNRIISVHLHPTSPGSKGPLLIPWTDTRAVPIHQHIYPPGGWIWHDIKQLLQLQSHNVKGVTMVRVSPYLVHLHFSPTRVHSLNSFTTTANRTWPLNSFPCQFSPCSHLYFVDLQLFPF